MTWEFIVLGILFLVIFVWKRFRKTQLLGFGDIVLVGLGIWMLSVGLAGLFGVAH